MTHASSELALSLINENTEQFPYQMRCEMAQMSVEANQWASHLVVYARWYQKQFDTPAFKASDILAAAAEIADYYERHVAEINAA